MKDKIDGLQIGRAIAAISVVLFHAKLTMLRFDESDITRLPWFSKYGDVGVTFFFVISGFIIAYVIEKNSYDIKGYFIKRFFRLWPIYALCTTIYIAIYLMMRNRPSYDLGFNPDFVFQSLFFWPMGKVPALQVGWSLEHEVIFYILAGLVGLVGGARVLLGALLLIMMGTLYFRIIAPLTGGMRIGFDYHLFSPLQLCFFLGVSLYLIWKKSPCSKPVFWIWGGALAVVIAPLIVELIPRLAEHNLVDRTLRKGLLRFSIEGLASAVMIYGLLSSPVQSVGAKMLAWVGDRSYSLYLIHFCFIPVFVLLHREYISWPGWMSLPLSFIFLAVSLLAASLLYRCIEKPTARYGSQLAASLRK